MFPVIAFMLFVLFAAFLLFLKVHGTIGSFKKRWYFGVIALTVPFFAEIVSVAKLAFKKDLLK